MGGKKKETEQITGKTTNLLGYAEENKKQGRRKNHQKANDKFLHNQ